MQNITQNRALILHSMHTNILYTDALYIKGP